MVDDIDEFFDGDDDWLEPLKTYGLPESFLSRVVRAEGGCWLWAGGRNGADSAGAYYDDFGRQWRAHRYAYRHVVGPIEPGMVITHSCGNSACVNPNHLVKETLAEAMKKRTGRTNVKPAQARQIRKLGADGVPQLALAKRFGVSQTTISNIIRGRTHKPGSKRAKLDWESVRQIRWLGSLGYRKTEISQFFEVSLPCVYQVVDRKTWKDDPEESAA